MLLNCIRLLQRQPMLSKASSASPIPYQQDPGVIPTEAIGCSTTAPSTHGRSGVRYAQAICYQHLIRRSKRTREHLHRVAER